MFGNLWEYLLYRWWGQLIIALLFYVIAAFQFWNISHQERTYPYISLDWVDWAIYARLGKWGCVSFWIFFGALFTFFGVYNLVDRIRYGKSDDE